MAVPAAVLLLAVAAAAAVLVAAAAPQVQNVDGTCLVNGYVTQMSATHNSQQPVTAEIVVPDLAGSSDPYTGILLRMTGTIVNTAPSSIQMRAYKGPLPAGVTLNDNKNGLLLNALEGGVLDISDADGGPGLYTVAIWVLCDGTLSSLGCSGAAAANGGSIPFNLHALLQKNTAFHVPIQTNRNTAVIETKIGNMHYFYGSVSKETKVFVDVGQPIVSTQAVLKATFNKYFSTRLDELPSTENPLITDSFRVGPGDFIVGVHSASADNFGINDKVGFFVNFGFGTNPTDQPVYQQFTCPAADGGEASTLNAVAPVPCTADIGSSCKSACGANDFTSCTCGDDNNVVVACASGLTSVAEGCRDLTGQCKASCGDKPVSRCECQNDNAAFACDAALASSAHRSHHNTVALAAAALLAATVVI